MKVLSPNEAAILGSLTRLKEANIYDEKFIKTLGSRLKSKDSKVIYNNLVSNWKRKSK